MSHQALLGARSFVFGDLRTQLARASPLRSGDQLAGVAAGSAQERVAACMALADVPLRSFLQQPVVPYEIDEVTRLIIDSHDAAAFAPVAHLTVGEFRDWLLGDAATTVTLAALAPGLTPEMVAAVSKLMRNQDLMAVAKKVSVVTRFRNTLGLPGHLAVRLQPNPPTDSPALVSLLQLLDGIVQQHAIPTQTCVLTHVTNTLQALELGAPVDLVFRGALRALDGDVPLARAHA